MSSQFSYCCDNSEYVAHLQYQQVDWKEYSEERPIICVLNRYFMVYWYNCLKTTSGPASGSREFLPHCQPLFSSKPVVLTQSNFIEINHEMGENRESVFLISLLKLQQIILKRHFISAIISQIVSMLLANILFLLGFISMPW